MFNTTVVVVSKDEISNQDTEPLLSKFREFETNDLQEKRNKVQLQIDGYSSDSRDLWDIDEVRTFYQKLMDSYDGLFYWLEIDIQSFLLVGLMLYQPVRSGTQATLTNEDIKMYLGRIFGGLNNFCDSRGLTTMETDMKLQAVLSG